MTATGELATVAQRVAVLLGAGVAPASAWRHAGEGTGLEAWARAVGAADPAGAGSVIAAGPAGAAGRATAAPDPAFAGLAAAWLVAVEAGAPLAEALRAHAGLLRGFAEAERRRRIALGGPIATSRLVLAMPAIGLLLGALLGQDVLGVLLGTPLGWGCLAGGGGLVLAAWHWNRVLLRRAARGDRLPGLAPELVATAMRGGVSVARARALVASAAERLGLSLGFDDVAAAVRVATAVGAPVAELLRSEAEEVRRAAIAEAAERVERLSVVLMIPLGVCVLPAFMLLGVVPMLVGVVGSTVAVL